MIFFQVAYKALFSSRNLIIYSESCIPRTRCWLRIKNRKSKLFLFEKKVHRASKYGWYAHRLVCSNLLYINTLVFCEPVRPRHQWPLSFLLFIKQVVWPGPIATPALCEGTSAVDCVPWWQSVSHGGRLAFWYFRNNWIYPKKKVPRQRSAPEIGVLGKKSSFYAEMWFCRVESEFYCNLST